MFFDRIRTVKFRRTGVAGRGADRMRQDHSCCLVGDLQVLWSTGDGSRDSLETV